MTKKLLFRCEGIRMEFPGTIALQDVGMDIYEGEVVGLVGENGAGKSTLLKIIMGVQKPTEGIMQMHCTAYEPKNSKEANQSGVGMVFQEQSLISNLTVGQNIFFGKERDYAKGPLISFKNMYADAQKLLDAIGIEGVKPGKKVSELDFAMRQMVEIVKVTRRTSHQGGKSLILLDEPTSVLNEAEIKKLFAEIQRLKEAGHAVIFVSHHLNEVLEISDRIYVFKDGQQVGMLDGNEIDEAVLYEKMVGRKSTGEYYKENRQQKADVEVILEVKNLGLLGSFKDVSFKLHKGEVLGITGVVGSGKEELCEVIAGIEAPTRGKMFIHNKIFKPSSPCSAVKDKVVCIPQERNEEGILGSLSIMENITISNFSKVSSHGWISKNKQLVTCNQWVEKLSIRCTDCLSSISSLSGGNAQKVVFARALNSDAKVLILNHPTRGVDVGAKEEIYSLIRDSVEQGIGVIVLGDTLDECIGLSSRIIVMKDGVVTREFTNDVGNKPNQIDIVKYMM